MPHRPGERPGENPMHDAELEAYYYGPEFYVEHLGITVYPGMPGLVRRYGSRERGENVRYRFTPSTTDELMVGVEYADSFFVDIDDLELGYDL